ncbi:hypothetical protein INR49_028195, partial [Caranx melampygus]
MELRRVGFYSTVSNFDLFSDNKPRESFYILKDLFIGIFSQNCMFSAAQRGPRLAVTICTNHI